MPMMIILLLSLVTPQLLVNAFVLPPAPAFGGICTSSTRASPHQCGSSSSPRSISSSGIVFQFALFYNDKNQNSNGGNNSSNSNRPSWWLPAPEWMQPSNDSSSQKQERQEEVTAAANNAASRTGQPAAAQVAKPDANSRDRIWNRFAQGKELQELRSDILQMKQNIQLSLATDDLMRVVALRKSLERAERRDPEFVYTRALKMIAGAGKYNTKKKYQILTRYNKEAKIARSFIPRLNMGGLWVANFGQGSELVNVTYSGDTLIATRLNTPEHFLFQADLSPVLDHDGSKNEGGGGSITSRLQQQEKLAPIPIDKSAISKWGVDKLERYPGKARSTAPHKSKSTALVEGNFIMFDGYFSFLWIPTRQHVFFSRPKPELVLKLLRDTISEQDEIENMREHLKKCYEKGIEEAFVRPIVQESTFVEPFRRISRESDLQAAQEEILIVYEKDSNISSPSMMSYNHVLSENAGGGVSSDNNSKGSSSTSPPVGKPHQSFWDFHKWLHYIDKAMKPNEMENNGA